MKRVLLGLRRETGRWEPLLGEAQANPEQVDPNGAWKALLLVEHVPESVDGPEKVRVTEFEVTRPTWAEKR